MTNDGQILCTSSATISAPASGATITLWASTGTGFTVLTPNQCIRIKRVIISVISSAASAASGLQIDESVDATNWDNLISYSISANTYTKNYVSVAAPYLRVRYVNSANVLTTWRFWVAIDQTERASQ